MVFHGARRPRRIVRQPERQVWRGRTVPLLRSTQNRRLSAHPARILDEFTSLTYLARLFSSTGRGLQFRTSNLPELIELSRLARKVPAPLALRTIGCFSSVPYCCPIARARACAGSGEWASNKASFPGMFDRRRNSRSSASSSESICRLRGATGPRLLLLPPFLFSRVLKPPAWKPLTQNSRIRNPRPEHFSRLRLRIFRATPAIAGAAQELTNSPSLRRSFRQSACSSVRLTVPKALWTKSTTAWTAAAATSRKRTASLTWSPKQ